MPWDGFRPLLERVWRKPEKDRKSRARRKTDGRGFSVQSAVPRCTSQQCRMTGSNIRSETGLPSVRFLGLGLEGRVPDAKTVWLHREALAQTGEAEELFALFDHHLARRAILRGAGRSLNW